MQPSFKIIAIVFLVIFGVSAWFFLRESRNSELPQSSVTRETPAAADKLSNSGRTNAVDASDDVMSESKRGVASDLDGAPGEEHADGSAELSASNNSIRSALRYEQPILSALDWDTASHGDLGTSAVTRNAAIWMTICKNESLVSRVSASGVSEQEGIASALSTFCEGFSEDIEAEIEQFSKSEADRFSRGDNTHSELMQLSQTRGAGAAVDQAIASMAASLKRLDYAQVLELVWLAGLLPSISPGPTDPEVKHAMSGDAQVAFAVSAAVYCRYLGDCQSRHPVVLLLCQQMWPDRQCTAPRDIHDAINQLLTGAEYEEYLAMVNFITARLGNLG